MIRYFSLTVCIVTILMFTQPLFGQNQSKDAELNQQGAENKKVDPNLSSQERAGLREKSKNISGEEKEKPRNQMRERASVFGREEQLKIVEGIESQLAKLKASIKEAPERDAFRKAQDVSAEQQAKMRKEWQKARKEQQQLVDDIQRQLAKLETPRQQIVKPNIPVTELKTISEIAVKENANKTAQYVDKLIAKYQRDSGDQPLRPVQARKAQEKLDNKSKKDIKESAPGEGTGVKAQ